MWSFWGPLGAVLKSMAVTALYVGSLYVMPSGRRDSDSPKGIMQRFVSIVFVCLFVTVVMARSLTLPSASLESPTRMSLTTQLTIFRHLVGLGSNCSALGSALTAVVVLTLLHLGPVWAHVLGCIQTGAPTCPLWSRPSALVARCRTWYSLRDLVLAPPVEEYIFRGVIPALLICEGWTLFSTTFWSTALFAIAHVHHVLRSRGSDGILAEIARQLMSPLLFGPLACQLLFRTGHLAAPWVAHVVFNYLGPPDLGWAAKSDLRYRKFRSIFICYVIGIFGSLSCLYLCTPSMLLRSPYPGLELLHLVNDGQLSSTTSSQ